jgi:hypothetical protein
MACRRAPARTTRSVWSLGNGGDGKWERVFKPYVWTVA